MSIKEKKVLLSFVLTSILVIPILAWAAAPPVVDITDNPSGSSATISLPNPLSNIKDPRVLLGVIINAVLGIVGSLALVVFIVGGITWMVSGGSPDKIAKGKNMLIWATLGLAIIFLSYVILQYIFQALTQK